MSANLITPAIDQPGSHGSVWQRLHSEREDICEALLKESEPIAKPSALEAATQAGPGNWHLELLQARLRKVDDALDRVLSGAYGDCVKCGRWIEDTKLHFDPAIAYCVECWQRLQNRGTGPLIRRKSKTEKAGSNDALGEVMGLSPLLPGIALETLAPYDTIQVQTLNSHYGIFLLEPGTGRVLVEGGSYFREPVEAVVYGSNLGGSTLRVGWIGIGMRIEMWVKQQLVSTSPVQSFYIQHLSDPEPASMFPEQMQKL
jgi:DnaK suppressor protein